MISELKLFLMFECLDSKWPPRQAHADIHHLVRADCYSGCQSVELMEIGIIIHLSYSI